MATRCACPGRDSAASPLVALVVIMLEATPTMKRPITRLAMFQASRLMAVPSRISTSPTCITGLKPMRSGRRPRNNRPHRAPAM